MIYFTIRNGQKNYLRVTQAKQTKKKGELGDLHLKLPGITSAKFRVVINLTGIL